MKTTINSERKFSLPGEILRSDHLEPGDVFHLERINTGRYLLRKETPHPSTFTVPTADDGLPVIHGGQAIITSALLKDIESHSL